MSALDTIMSMDTGEFEKLALRIARELGFEVKGTKVTEGSVEMDSYMRLPTGETLHYLFIVSRAGISAELLKEILDRVNNPFIKILVMSAGDVEDEAVSFAKMKGIELSQWDQFLQFLEKYGVLRELEKRPVEDAPFLPSLGEVQSMEAWARNFMEEGEYRKALEYIDRGLDIKPEYVPLLRMKGDVLHSLGRDMEAIDWYRRATSVSENDAGSWISLASILEEKGDFSGALAALDRLTGLMPDSYNAWMQKGDLLYGQGKYEEALLCFNKAAKISPTGKEAWNNRGLVLKHMGKYEEAVDSFNRSLSIDPVFWDALINKALLLHERGMYNQAIDVYTYMLRIREDPLIYCQRGIAYAEWGMKGEAADDFRKALELNPELRACRKEMEALGIEKEPEPLPEPEPEPEEVIEEETEKEGDGEKAMHSAIAAIIGSAAVSEASEEEESEETEEKKEETLPEAEPEPEVMEAEEAPVEEPEERPNILSGISSLSQLMTRGDLYFKLGMLDEALQCYEGLLEAKPRSKEILNGYGTILYLLGRRDEALNAFKKAVDIDPGFESARMNMLQIYIDSGKLPKSLDLMNSIIREKRSAPLWIRRGKILEEMDREGASIQSYQKALEIRSGMIRVWNAMGISYHLIGEDDDALEAFESGISADERDAVLWSNYGTVQYLKGDSESAIESFERGLSEDVSLAAIHNNMGVILAEKGDEGGARERFSVALERDESATYAYNNMKYL